MLSAKARRLGGRCPRAKSTRSFRATMLDNTDGGVRRRSNSYPFYTLEAFAAPSALHFA